MRCQLTGKHVRVGNKVSHSNRKSKRGFKINVKPFTLYSQLLSRSFKIKLAVSTLRTLEYKGGLDGFLLASKDDSLSLKGRRIKKQIGKGVNAVQA